jgi:import inner membrane translocase subunit TIM17
VDDFGNGFSLGCAGGVVFYFLRGMWFAPKRERFMGGIMLLKKRAPILGGNPLLTQATSPSGQASSPPPTAP